MKIKKSSMDFIEPGSKNIDEVIRAVTKRVKEYVENVVVASTSGGGNT